MTRKERLAIPPLRYYTRQHHTRAQLMHLMLDPARLPRSASSGGVGGATYASACAAPAVRWASLCLEGT